MLHTVLILILLSGSSMVFAQQFDTLLIVSYNLDDFRNGPGLNRLSSITDVMDNTRPNILICQGVNDSNGARLISSLSGIQHGQKQSPYLGYGHGVLVYDSTRVQLLVYNVVPTGHLPIDEWIMYAPISSDTFIIASCQFIEGADSVSVAERAVQAQALRAHLHQRRSEKIVVVGTLNFYSSTEAGFHWLTEDVPFGDSLLRNAVKDPIGLTGVWHRNSNFARWHTYCTRIDTTLDTSGLVDRFDYVLVTPDLLYKSLSLDSYTVIGNFGTKFGKSATKNGQVITTLTSGLENGSRHLPLAFELIFRTTTIGVERIDNLPKAMDLSANQDGVQ